MVKGLLIVIRERQPPILGLRKNVTRNCVPYSQTAWLTPAQLRGPAIGETF